MSAKQCCRLCCNSCNEYEWLQNEFGDINEVYDITVKYFDPMLLKEKQNSDEIKFNVLCHNCWRHINDFHEFQKGVLLTRNSLEICYTIIQMEAEIKQEVKQEHTPPNDKVKDEHSSCFDSDKNNHKDYDCFSDDNTSNNDGDDDEMPLITLRNLIKEEQMQFDEHKIEEKTNFENVEEKSKSRRGRKLKNSVRDESKVENEQRKTKNLQLADDNKEDNSKYVEKGMESEWKPELECNDDDENFLTLREGEDKNQIRSLCIKVKQEVDQSDVDTSIPGSKHFDRNEEALFDGDYFEIGNVKIESPKCFDDIPIKTSNTEESVHKQIENSVELEGAAESIQSLDSAIEVKVNSEDKKLKITKSAKEKESSSRNLEKYGESNAFIAQWMPELVCDLCSKTANNFDELRIHFKEKHNTRVYIKCCQRKFFYRYGLVYHIQLHLNPDIHKCDICGKSTSTKHTLRLHKNAMHEDTKFKCDSKQFKCDTCEKLFKQKGALQKHLLTHATGNKDFVCSECGKGYVLEQLLKIHIKNVHKVDRICDQCGKTIHGFKALRKHRMEHAGIEKPKFPCDECGLELKHSIYLKRHKAAYHNDGSIIYVCGVCGKVSPSEHALRVHKRLVHETKPKHKCTYCDKAFKSPKALREHIAKHTGQDLYQCPHCPQAFKVSANMHNHRKKVHPVEYEEGRKKRLQWPKIDKSKEKKQIVIC